MVSTLARRIGLVVSLSLVVAGCGSDDPAPQPVAPTPTTSTVQVRTSGDAGGPLDIGQTRQLTATATLSTGTTQDVTAQATWQSSATGVATVSPAGLVTAVADGDADISATFQSVRGALGVGVRRVRCEISLSPSAASYGFFGGAGTVQVLVSASTCRWSARSDAAWLPFGYEPSAPGSSTFTYDVPPNSTTGPRTANIVVTSSTGETTTHAVAVDYTRGCSYVTDPEEATFAAAGGTGQFRVVATPSNCQWNLVNGMAALGVQVTSGFSGTGDGLVRYSVQAHTRDVDADGYLEVAGLSGANPNGRHHIIIRRR